MLIPMAMAMMAMTTQLITVAPSTHDVRDFPFLILFAGFAILVSLPAGVDKMDCLHYIRSGAIAQAKNQAAPLCSPAVGAEADHRRGADTVRGFVPRAEQRGERFFMRSSSFRYGSFWRTMVYWFWDFGPENRDFTMVDSPLICNRKGRKDPS